MAQNKSGLDIGFTLNFPKISEELIPVKYTKKVIYGIPEETTERKEDKKDKPLNNASILWIMEHGSMVNNIPERPLLGPVRNKYIDDINNKYLSQVLDALVDKDTSTADFIMNRLALFMETKTKKFFTDADNDWAPNSYITIHGGWIKNKQTGKPVYIKGKKSSRPLIDTGELRRSVRGLVVDYDKKNNR